MQITNMAKNEAFFHTMKREGLLWSVPVLEFVDREHVNMQCVIDLKNDFVVVVFIVVVLLLLGAKLFSKFPQKWKIVLNLEKNMQYGWFIPD